VVCGEGGAATVRIARFGLREGKVKGAVRLKKKRIVPLKKKKVGQKAPPKRSCSGGSKDKGGKNAPKKRRTGGGFCSGYASAL